MLRVGLTGGIGSGKSTVARFLELLGIPVYYADARAKILMQSDPGLIAAIQEYFGKDVYRTEESGSVYLDRPLLASRVFGKPQELEILNSLVHPAITVDFGKWAAGWEKAGTVPYVVEEAAVMIESGSWKKMDKILVVTAPQALRVERVIKRDHVSEEAACARVNAQLTDEQRNGYADFLIRCDEAELVIPQILAVHRQLST